MARDIATVASVAGRRIDPPGATLARFPSWSVPRVQAALKVLFLECRTKAIVSSAACGADILALETARDLRLRTRIVLPFAPDRFRKTSVVDRGSEWGPRFDALVSEAEGRGDLVVLAQPEGGDNDAAYAAATKRIIDETLGFARASGAAALAVAIWDERPRTTTDATKAFIDLAASAGMECRSIPTCDPC